MAIREEVATINGRRSDGHNITRQIQRRSESQEAIDELRSTVS